MIFIPQYSHVPPPYAYWENAFADEEIEMIKHMTSAPVLMQEAEVGGVGNQGNVDKNVRRSKINWLSSDDTDKRWIFNRLAHVVAELNYDHYRYDLTGFREAIQLTNYFSEDKGHYHWHVDSGNGNVRKMSLVMQLTEPDKYEGGQLQIASPYNNDICDVPKQKGLVVIFPSTTKHQVTPVTSGHRQSLVSWIEGPPIR